ncbi:MULTISPECIES: site-specific integrase [Tepidanaerobacter]|uniref:site-specific integrase n=1 Tax=Tepidanaerobacter TaxID=499228 RepID=UPI001BD5EB40|nr:MULTISPECIES: site-specific integrase [Tepidanaerobacter]
MKWYVTKRGSKFTAIIELGKDPLTGKRKQKWLSGFESEADANIGAVKYIKKYKAGLLTDSQNASFDDFLSYWLEQKVEPSTSHGTYSSYKIMIDKYILPALGQIKLAKLQTSDIQNLINAMNKKGLSHRYMDYCRVIINAALNFAVERRFIEHNPCKNIIVPKKDTETKIKTYTAEEVEELLRDTKDKPIHLPILLTVTCGLRRGEILALKWPDTNFATKSKSRVKTPDGEVFEKDPKTRSSIRTIAMPDILIEELKAEKERQEKKQKRFWQ